MIKLIVDKNGDNKKLIPFLQNKFNNLSSGTIYKALRNKDIRVNNVKIKENIVLHKDDCIVAYISDKFLYGTSNLMLKIVYEDENIIIIDKPQGILVQTDGNDIGIDNYVSEHCNVPYTMPCHRLDRNTSGLVIFAKNKIAESTILKMIKDRSVRKIYHARVWGIPKEKNIVANAYLFKDAKKSNVIISDIPKKGYSKIITKYSLIEKYDDGTSLLEVELITGKTHQIRAHLAHMGLPIIGDGKYGVNNINKKFKVAKQELRAYKLHFEDSYPPLEYLKGKTIIC